MTPKEKPKEKPTAAKHVTPRKKEQTPVKKRPRRRWSREVRPPVSTISDPKAPKKGEPIPVRGVGSRSAKSHQTLLTAHGKTMCLGAWCRALGITRNTLRRRLSLYSVEEAVSPNFGEISLERCKALGIRNRKRNISPEVREKMRRNMLSGKALAAARAKERRYTANGETHTLAEWAKILGVKHHTLYTRVHRPNADLDKALSSRGNISATRGGAWASAHPGFNEYRRKWRAERRSGKGGKKGGRRG